MTRSSPNTLLTNGLLALGFLALTGAIVVAHSTPASGYELSLYTATPIAVWVLLGCSLTISLAVAFQTTADWPRRLALWLGGGAFLVFVGLPVLRGYWFISGGDALTHLGWVRAIESGVFHPVELRYPGLHTASTILSSAIGIELAHALMLIIVALCGLFACFVAMSTSLVFESRYSLAVGAFSAFLLLPITTLSTHIMPHAMSQAILFSTVLIYLLLKYLRSGDSGSPITTTGVLFSITLIAVVLYHPQLAAHLLAVFVGICGVQFLYRRFSPESPIARHRTLYGQTAVLGAAFLVWVMNHRFITDVINFHLSSTVEYFLTGRSSESSIAGQSESLTAIGGSFLEIFLKLLGTSLVFGILSAFVFLWVLFDTSGRANRTTHGLVPYFVVAMVVLSGLFGVYFFGSSGDMYFRVLGLILLFVTITGAVAIASGATAVSRIAPPTLVHGTLSVAFAILLVASLLAVFPSPYIYNPSPHVTDQAMSGHEVALDRAADDVAFDGIRGGPNRYADATSPGLERTRVHGSISGEEIESGIISQYDGERYLSVARQDWERETVAYRELRYSESQLSSIEAQPGVNRIQSNGELNVYYVSGSDTG